MNYFSITEITGYAASLIVLLSFLMRDMRKLRIINCVGCALFVLYGILLAYSIPIIITNMSIIGIHAYYLVKIFY